MAERAVTITPVWPGLGAAAGVAALILAALVAVALRAETGAGLGAGDVAAIRFTLLQAALSAVVSVAIAIPLARALARRRFAGRRALITLLGAPFILPVIVAVMGFLVVFGRAGWVNLALGTVGVAPLSIYGLHGVVLAHVFFNLPLATRLILQGWQDVPAEQFRLAAQLGAGPGDIARLIERPILRRVVPGALAVVFAICLTSFAVALTLGGGPRATTIELAIYQAFRFDFDMGRASLLGGLQIMLTLGAACLALWSTRGRNWSGAGLDRPVERWDAAHWMLRVQDAGLVLLAAGFLILPLAAIVVAGLPGLARLPNAVFMSAGFSLAVALASTLTMLCLALPMALAAAQGRVGAELAGLLGLAVSPLVIGTGLFILLYPLADPFALALPVTALVNALMALPFALRILIPPVREVLGTQGKLAVSLNMSGWPFFRLVLLPRLRGPLGFATGLSAALSMGDLGVIALFADPELATLPLQIFRLRGAYQIDAAAGASLLLLVLSMGVFWLCDRGGRSHVAD